MNTFFAYECAPAPGWRIIDERTGADAFGPNVVALSKQSAVQLINDRGAPAAKPITRAPNPLDDLLDAICPGHR